MKIYYKLPILAGVALMALATSSCSDNDWTPGPDAPDNMAVYFTAVPAASYNKIATEDLTIEVPVRRNNYAEAASIPLQVTTTAEGVTIPATIEFEAGQRTTTLLIDYSGLPSKTSCDISVAIDPSETSPYSDGATSFNTTVFVTQWLLLADDVYYYSGYESSGSNKFEGFDGGNLYVLDGTQTYKLEGIFGSYIDLTFTLGRKYRYNGSVYYESYYPYSYYEVEPENNFVWDDDYEASAGYTKDRAWYLYNDETGRYPVWALPDNDKTVTYWLIYNEYWSGSSTAYFGPYIKSDSGDYGFGSLFGYLWFGDGTGGWEYVNFSFTPLLDPFADDSSSSDDSDDDNSAE